MALSILVTRKPADGMSDDLIADELFGEEYERKFVPSLADRLQVGFLDSDHATQTIESEIPRIKALTKSVQELVTEMGNVKKNLHFSRNVIVAKYTRDVEDVAHEFSSRLREKMQEMTRIHEERVDVVRRSFRQQMQDALVKMSAKYKKYYEDKLGGKLASTVPSSDRKNYALEAEVRRCQSIIQMMEIQMEELRKELDNKPTVTEIIMDTEELDAALAQNATLQEEITQLTSKVKDLSDTVEFREDAIRKLNIEINEQQEETEKERVTSRKLAQKVEDLKVELNKSELAWKKDVDKMKSSMREDMAGEMKKQMEAQQALFVNQERAMKEAELDKQRAVEEERRKFESLLAKEREIIEKMRKEAVSKKSSEVNLEQKTNEVTVLKTRITKAQKQWEKKFVILRSSLHALKDESYIRQQLQKQAATLKYASISYGGDMAGPRQSTVPPAATGTLNPNKPLPSIRGDSGKKPSLATNTLPSGPGTEVFTTGAVDSSDEQEIEEYVQGFVPLPSPPHWQKNQFGEYMPSIDGNATL